MTRRVHECLECGNETKISSRFCGTVCRTSFNNRRKSQGAELYDLYMAHRFERDRAKRLRIFQAINRLASNFRKDDRQRRGGRKSWRDPAEVLSERPYLRAIATFDGTGRGVVR